MNSSFRTIELSDPENERDGLRFMTIKTPNLAGRGDLCVFVPEVPEGTTGLPICILLHGVYGSAWIWGMKGQAHLTAQRMIHDEEIRPMILAMPSDGLWGDGSAYFGHQGKHFDRWIVEDVPLAIRENIPQADASSELCIGGLSMGGYGALSLGSRFPEKFKAISGHSSITVLDEMKFFVEEPLDEYTANCDTPNVIDSITANRDRLPALRFDCGVDDELITGNRTLHQQLQQAAIPHTYEEFAGGHEWPYWQEHLAKTLTFFDQNLHT
ncbi:alpha/beta hydrolase [Marinoscillum furvescens]|uniref:S-formylglutathione hydrolase FrmB n=1 Tax=Marinoscillum furvescens DSM 4134 TaxID=1122208 RepID=A0A3D9L535_MARFU|nr:alpha/beta hydrolase-fold protein [Marinoscillum furvescens]REE00202.1 S-formylglutathione hydrolase FrmB [Marinoscillum furvescens DSM 4134]